LCILYFVVPVKNSLISFHAAAEKSIAYRVHSPSEKSSENVAWTAVDKRTLVKLVDLLTCVDDSVFQCEEGEIHLKTTETADNKPDELRRREKASRSDIESTMGDSMSEKDTVKQLETGLQQTPTHKHQQRERTLHDESSVKHVNQDEEVMEWCRRVSSCPEVPKNHTTVSEIQHHSKPPPVVRVNSLVSAGQSRNCRQVHAGKAGNGFPEVWTSVDKSLVEGLFDQLLRSFDNIHVARTETDRVETDGSRDRRLSPPADATRDDDGAALWRSMAYKWKSNILLRMRNQQVTARDVVLRRKRRYTDQKSVPII